MNPRAIPDQTGSDARATETDLASGLADARGIPRHGRREEHASLRAAGAIDLAWGRLYEGHVNALQLIARLGTDDQRARGADDVAANRLFGVWNTEAADGVRIGLAENYRVTLSGRKTFASGVGRVARAIISIAWPGGASQLAVVPMDAVATTIDESFWREPYGMQGSESFAVDFSGVELGSDALLGVPGDYQRGPWLMAGASRFLAVQTGGIEQLVADFGAFLRRRNFQDDAIQLTRLGECSVAARTAILWTTACADAWAAFDADANAHTEAELLTTVDAARLAVERCALDVAELVERGVGARGLLATEPFARRLRDLRMYLRQPAIDATLLRVARASITPRAID